MAKAPKHGLQQTKGEVQVRGKVTGTEKENFFKEITTKKTGKPMYFLNFGVEFDKGRTLYFSLQAMRPEEIYFYEKAKEGEDKGTTHKVPYDNMDSFKVKNPDAMVIGKSIGIEKDEEGKNITNGFCDYDAIRYLRATLKDGMSVSIIGELEWSSYVKDGNKKRSVKFVPNKIYGCKEEIDFEEENFESKAVFSQQIVVGEYGETSDGDVSVVSKIIHYGSIEDGEFVIKKENPLGITFKNKLEPYNTIKVHGNIEVSEKVEVVVVDDEWGLPDPTKNVNAPTKREFVITGADPSSIDVELYTEEKMAEGIRKMKAEEQANNDWGTTASTTTNDNWDDGEEPW